MDFIANGEWRWRAGSIDEEGAHGVTDPVGGVVRPFDEYVGDAVAAEIGGTEDEFAASIAEDGTLEIGVEPDLCVGGKVFGHDGQPIDAGSVGPDEDELRVCCLTDFGDRECIHGSARYDVSGFRDARENGVGTRIVGGYREGAGGSAGFGAFGPGKGA